MGQTKKKARRVGVGQLQTQVLGLGSAWDLGSVGWQREQNRSTTWVDSMGQLWIWGLGLGSTWDLGSVGRRRGQDGSAMWVNGVGRQHGLGEWAGDVELWVGRWL